MAVPFILLHGFAQTPASWDTVARALQAQGHRTYVPDLLSGGESLALPLACGAGEEAERRGAVGGGPRDAAASLPHSLDSLAAVCDRIDATVRLVAEAEGAPVLVGYSMGGRLAAETLVRHPDLPLAGLVLESAGLGPADEAAREALAERNGAWAARLREEGAAAFMDWWEELPLFATQRELSAETRAAIRVERMAHDAESLARSLEAWGAQHQASEADALAALAQLRDRGVPVRYLAGALDAKYAAVADRARAAGVPATAVPHAGHNVHVEQPTTFREILAEFLA